MTKTIDLEQLKKIELKLLSQVHEICVECGFRYSLGGGTLLGAVRHKGFIPWDDDIDIMMPRPDYDAFISYCASHEVPFAVCSWENDKSYVDMSAKVYDPNTVLKDENIVKTDLNVGVFIDVFPIDGLGDTYDEAKKRFQSTSIKRSLLVAAQWKKFFRSKTHAWYYEPARFGAYVASRCINKKKTFAKVLKKYTDIDFDSAKFVGAVGGSYRLKEILPVTLYTDYVDLDFEGQKFKAIAGYDEYLKSLYGDYMTLPPEEKRVSHHTFEAFYKDDIGEADE
ncbi:MAG: LicD family protein [Clostridiales bacterium]|nr:LicD family protein [Clostridiales bacterium]